jgi:uncharacterized protein (DUF2062 family)
MEVLPVLLSFVIGEFVAGAITYLMIKIKSISNFQWNILQWKKQEAKSQNVLLTAYLNTYL